MKATSLAILITLAGAFAFAQEVPPPRPTTIPPGNQVTLAWDANPEPDIAGYRLHYGTESGVFPQMVDVGNVTTSVLTLPKGGTYYAVVTAYNTASLESLPSNEVAFSTPPPGAPTGLRVTVTVQVEIQQ